MRNFARKSLGKLASFGALLLTAACATSTPRGAETAQAPYVTPPPVTAKAYSDVLVGRFAWLTYDRGTASDAYARAALRNPNDRRVVGAAMRASLSAENVEAAVHIAQWAGESDQLDEAPLVRILLAADHLKARRYAEAYAVATQGAPGHIFDAQILELIAAFAAYGDGDLEAASEILTQRRVQPGAFSDAAMFASSVLAYDAGYEALAHEWLETAVNRRSAMRQPSSLSIAALARYVAERGHSETAIELVDEASMLTTGDVVLEELTARFSRGDFGGYSRSDPARMAAISLHWAAATLAARVRDVRPTEYFALALFLDPEMDEARFAIADTLLSAGLNDQGAGVLGRVDDRSIYAPVAGTQIAWIDRAQGREAMALGRVDALKADASGWTLRSRIADLYRSLDRFDEAEVIYTALLGDVGLETADASRLYWARGSARRNLDRWPEAEADLKRALELSPDSADILNYLGYLWVDQGVNLEEAFKMIKRAVELRPNAGYIVDSLGWAYYRLGRYGEAAEHLERAVELSPSDPTINDHYGDALWRIGREREARFQWRRALSLNPDAEIRTALEIKLEDGLDFRPDGDTPPGLAAAEATAETALP